MGWAIKRIYLTFSTTSRSMVMRRVAPRSDHRLNDGPGSFGQLQTYILVVTVHYGRLNLVNRGRGFLELDFRRGIHLDRMRVRVFPSIGGNILTIIFNICQYIAKRGLLDIAQHAVGTAYPGEHCADLCLGFAVRLRRCAGRAAPTSQKRIADQVDKTYPGGGSSALTSKTQRSKVFLVSLETMTRTTWLMVWVINHSKKVGELSEVPLGACF